MRHHRHNPGFDFVKPPIEFNKQTEKEVLQYCLGGVLYMPGTKNILEKILAGKPPAPSLVMCVEDAISTEDVPLAEKNIVYHLDQLAIALRNGSIPAGELPLFFVRVRNPAQFKQFASRLTPAQAAVLTGFVFPKFDSSNGGDYFRVLEEVSASTGAFLYGMPILEGDKIAIKASRMNELEQIKRLLSDYRKMVLNVRVGATDFSSIFGVRRGINYTIYDIMTVRDCLADILNYLSCCDDGFVISAPVWEYFLMDKNVNIEHLLEQDIHCSLLRRNSIVNEAVDGLLREVILDKANGFVGKTIIHPSHLKYVNAMQAVTREEYDDAMQVLDASGGVVKSLQQNKMNEVSPHRSWAEKTVRRAQSFGVIENERSYLRLIFGS